MPRPGLCRTGESKLWDFRHSGGAVRHNTEILDLAILTLLPLTGSSNHKEPTMTTYTTTTIPVITDIAHELFGDHLHRFRQHLIDQHYKESTVKQYIHGIDALAPIMQSEKIALEDLDEAQALELVAKIGGIERSRPFYVSIARRFVRFLNEQGVAKRVLTAA
jgi:hypothetical protein